MKKIFLIIMIFFLSINNIKALTIEEELNNLKNQANQIEEKINNLEASRLNKTYPIGSIYITTTYSSPEAVANAIGGTWEAYGSGRTLVGVDPNNTSFNSVNKTGGSSTTTLGTSNLPSHTHNIPSLSGTAASAGTHTHNNTAKSSTITGEFGALVPNNHAKWHSGAFASASLLATNSSDAVKSTTTTSVIYGYKLEATPTITMTNASAGAHTHTITTTASTSGSVGSGTAFTNLQPYITVYMYKRVA